MTPFTKVLGFHRQLLILAIFLMSFSGSLCAQEEVAIIQTVSESRKSFVIRRGFSNGITPQQEALFTTTKFALMARAVEVNRSYSLWQILEAEAVVPFEKDQFVYFNPSPISLDFGMPNISAVAQAGNPEFKEGAQNFSRPIIFKSQSFWSLRVNTSLTLSETVSDVSSANETSRSGFQGELHYHKMFWHNWEFSVGLRIDEETATTKNETTQFDLTTTRTFLVGDLTYILDTFAGMKGNLYASLGAGIGYSATNISGEVGTGSAMVLPSFRVGYLYNRGEYNGFVIEGIIESLNSSETYNEGGQESSYVNFKGSIGYRF